MKGEAQGRYKDGVFPTEERTEHDRLRDRLSDTTTSTFRRNTLRSLFSLELKPKRILVQSGIAPSILGIGGFSTPAEYSSRTHKRQNALLASG